MDLGECREDEGFVARHEIGLMEVRQVSVDAAEKRKATAENYEKISKQLRGV